MQADLTVSIVNHSNPELLHDCLRSLFASARRIALDVWVVDNATDGRGVSAMRAEFPQVKWLFNSRRLGFSANHNQVLRRAEGRYACILNDDTVIRDGAFDAVVGFMDSQPRVGMAGPKLLNPDGSIQESAFRHSTVLTELLDVCLLPRRMCGLKRRHVEKAQYGDRAAAVEFVLGACIVVRASTLREVGLLDEELAPVGDSEDWDWCYRAAKAGWEVAFVPAAEVVHYGGQSFGGPNPASDRRAVNMRRTRVRYFRKHFGPRMALAVRLVYLLALPWNAMMLTQSLFRRRLGVRGFRDGVATYWRIATLRV